MKSKGEQKIGLHPRNRHRNGYDFAVLSRSLPALQPLVFRNQYGNQTVDFADPLAVKTLNQALLAHYYQIRYWDIPAGYLCPPIPSRVDYLHRIADLLSADVTELDKPPVRALDIGVGANCIYPLLGAREYGWSFVGADIDPVSIKAARLLVSANGLAARIELRLQNQPQQLFCNIIKANERFTVSVCNPPFHRSLDEALAGNIQKRRNLGKLSNNQPVLNFGGQKAELWCEGGEARFLTDMIKESCQFKQQCLWFTSLVSKQENLALLKKQLQLVGAATVTVLEMQHGNKVSRILAWSFFNKAGRQAWWKQTNY